MFTIVFGRVGETSVPVGRGMSWIEVDRFCEVGDGGVDVALRKLGGAAPASRLGIVRCESNHAIVVGDRGPRIAVSLLQEAAMPQSLPGIGLELDHMVE